MTASGGGIHIDGNVTGIVQTGSHAQASYTHTEALPPETMASPEVQRLMAAVEALREQLRAVTSDELPTEDARIAEEALDEAVGAVPESGEPDTGRLRRALATVTGALSTTAGLAQAVEALREAASRCF